ncbi:toxin-antitoxin system HicB family antitoxin [Sphingobium aquiterrae]|uniref:toxin-antitoxin system HicB family antitoxin n=1 Tax=Sphingobium aquiterrae TaxID=2038656 RepID=UPI003016323A
MPPRDQPPAKKAFPLRIDQSLFDALERCAAAEFRSVNAQVEMLLREGLKRRGVTLAAPEARKRGRPPGNGREEGDTR